MDLTTSATLIAAVATLIAAAAAWGSWRAALAANRTAADSAWNQHSSLRSMDSVPGA